MLTFHPIRERRLELLQRRWGFPFRFFDVTNTLMPVYVAHDHQNVPIGIIHFSEDTIPNEEDKVLFIYRLLISPLYRKKGYGRKMVEFARDRAKEYGYKKMALYSVEEAEGFWERNGFSVDDHLFTCYTT